MKTPNSDRFRILSLDGASVTGGMGWMGMGVLRDYLHRHLQLCPGAESQHTEILNVIDESLVHLPFRRPKGKLRKPTDHIKFLQGLAALPDKVGKEKQVRALALWLRYQHDYRWRKREQEEAISPLISELATMMLAFRLQRASDHGTDQVTEHILESLGNIAKSDKVKWRANAAMKNNEIPIEEVITQIVSKDISGIVKLLLDRPWEFLTLRWVTGSPIDPLQSNFFLEAKKTLYHWIETGLMSNPLFGKITDIDLIAGTSSGGLNALILAKNHHSLNAGIEEALQMWTEIISMNPNSDGPNPLSPRFMQAFVGKKSLSGTSSDAIYQKHFGDGLTLKDLKRPVAITAVQLDSGEVNSNPVLRRWKPIVYHNHPPIPTRSQTAPRDETEWLLASDLTFSGIRLFPGSERTPLDKISVLNVARHTSTIPILNPVHRGPNHFPKLGAPFQHNDFSGYIDDGFYANNPSLIAISAARAWGRSLDDICVVSLGNGRQGQDFVELMEEDLGYRAWLMAPRRQGLLLDITLDVGIDAINTYCNAILGPTRQDDSKAADS